MSKIRVCVVFGGASSEHDVSLVSATHVIKNIPKDKYEIICLGITKKGRWLFYPGDVSHITTGEWEKNPDCTPAVISPDPIHRGIIKLETEGVSVTHIDVVFPVLHGKNGEDGTIQGLLELARIPYVGCNLLASANCMDKALTHTILDSNGVKTARWASLIHEDLNRLDDKCSAIAKKLGFPLFVKPANCGSSIGINKASDIESLKNAIKLAFTHDSKVVVEEFIKGKELECAVFGLENPISSVIGEIESCNDFYDYDAKYILGDTGLYIPARIDESDSGRIREIAVKAYKAIGCEGLSRVDFFLTDDGEIILNEINTMPGFTPISMYPKLMNEVGIPYGDLVDRLIELALEKSR